MVDVPNNNDPQQPPVPMVEEKPAGFLASRTGKLVVGGVALVTVVLLALGAILWVFVFSPASSQSPGQVTSQVVTPAVNTASSSTPASDSAPITEPQQKPLESTFTFRNVFAPTLKQPTPPAVIASITAPATSTASGSSSSGSSSSSTNIKVPKDTLFLVSIQTVDGEKTATFIWNGATYTLPEGGTIPDTPWKVVEIGDSSVVMLFGDTQVTLTTGQGLSK